MTPRNDIYQALFALIAGTQLGTPPAAAFATTGKRLLHWSEVPPIQQPAFFLALGSQEALFTQKIPTRWKLHAWAHFYACVDESDTQSPMELLNPIVDAIVAALQPKPPYGEQTLGGLVEYCRISGNIETDEGTLGSQAVVIMPIEMFTPQ